MQLRSRSRRARDPGPRVARAVALGLAAAVALPWAGATEDEPAATPPPATLSRAADGSLRIENVGLEDALRLAQAWIENGQAPLAEQLLAQLAPVWPGEPRIPFLRGMAARAQGDNGAAIAQFRAALDQDPDLQRVRYELAQTYFDERDWDQAAFHYRFVLGSDAPDLVKADVAARLIAIADQQRWTFSFEAALAPSSNINVAPSDAVIDPIFGSENPAVLTGDSIAQSGLGVRAAAGASRQFALSRLDSPSRRVRAQLGAAASATDYEGARFDDSAASLLAGITLRRGTGVIGGDLRAIRRWYGGDAYEDAASARIYGERRIAAPASLRLELSIAARDNLVRDDLDGVHSRAAGRLRLARSSSSFVYAELAASRFAADARATSYTDGAVTIGGYKDFAGGLSVDVAPSVLRREHDGPDPFFQRTQEDTRWSLAAAVIKRDVQLRGFAPFVRYRYTRNDSTLKLHDFEQHAAEFGLTGVF